MRSRDANGIERKGLAQMKIARPACGGTQTSAEHSVMVAGCSSDPPARGRRHFRELSPPIGRHASSKTRRSKWAAFPRSFHGGGSNPARARFSWEGG